MGRYASNTRPSRAVRLFFASVQGNDLRGKDVTLGDTLQRTGILLLPLIHLPHLAVGPLQDEFDRQSRAHGAQAEHSERDTA